MDAMADTAWIRSVRREPQDVASAIDAGVQAIGQTPQAGDRWAVKLNLTYPTYLPGVVNSPVFVEGLCRWASDHRVRLILVEGDGGNGSYSAQDTFDGNGVTAIAERHGMSCVSISEKPWEWRSTPVAGLKVRLPYSPFFVRREYDRFITAPVFKNHIFTVVSLGMKNFWGCIPDAYRMYYHHFLDHGIVALVKELKPDFSIFDGIIGLCGRGPMDGRPLDLNQVMVAGSVGAGEAAALKIMGVASARVRHLSIARQEGLMPAPGDVRWLVDPKPFLRTDFIVRRSLMNYLSIQLGRYPSLQRWIYHSRLSAGIYKVVDLLRRDSAQSRLVRAKTQGEYHSITFHER
jgi:uncharacterized protein (DUF362 family)